METRENLQNKGIFISETADSLLVYDRNSGNVCFLNNKDELENSCKQFELLPERKSVYTKPQNNAFKINLSTVCNLNCDYCFRNKEAHIRTDVSKAKKIIDYVIKNYSDKVVDFSFSVNLSSEALLEFEKIKEVKSYIEEKTTPLFCYADFENVEDAMRYLNCFPIELTGNIELYTSVEQIVDAMNGWFDRNDMVCHFPLPEGMKLPWWEAGQYRNAKNLEGRNLWLFNRRFMEVLFPETFKRKPSYVFFICTNGTFYSDEIVQFFKEINLDTVCVSFDGPSRVHDKHRFFYDYSASHALILENIKKFMRAGLKVSVASVLTADFPYPLQLAEYFKSIDAAGISMVCVRTGKNGSFDNQSIENLIEGYKMLFERFFNDVCKNDYSLIELLRDDYCFTGIKMLLSKGRLGHRCGWNEDIIFDSNGEVYPCDYFMGNKDYLRGSINSEGIKDVCAEMLDVNDREKCKDCWCKYLCGGTCYYNSIKTNGNIGKPDETECKLNMAVRQMSILFIQKLLEKGIDLYKFGRHLGFNYDDSLEVGKKYFVRRGLKIFVKGTLSRLEMEIKKAEKWLCDAGAKCSEELFITIKSNEQAGSNRVLNAEVIIPYSGCGKGRKKEHCSTGGDFEGRCMEGLSAQWVREMDFGYCFSDQSNSEEKNIERVKNNLKDLIFTFGIAVNGTYWFKAKKDVFFNYSKGNVEVFICKKTGIY